MLKGIKNNNKGFTLIELLAVIVIMGILMVVAVPAVTKYIAKAKQDTFADTAKSYINSARYSYLNDEFDCSNTEGKFYIKTSTDMLEKGGKSSWNNKTITAYVLIDATATKVTYSFIGSDGTHGIKTATEESAIDGKSVATAGASVPSTPSGYTQCKQ